MVIDLYKDYTPQQIKILVDSVSSSRPCSREKAEDISKNLRRYWKDLSHEAYNGRCDINRDRWTWEERNKASLKSKEQWAGYSEERKEVELSKVFHNEKYRRAFAEARGNMTPEETENWINRSFHNPEAKKLAIKNMSLGVEKWWGSLSKEQREKEILKRVTASAKVNAKGPSWDELFLGLWLEEYYPGEWKYNGRGKDVVIIGGRIPDFININGKKEVIEVFGIYWHSESDVEQRKVDYKKYGFDCKVIWDYECFPSEMEKILGGRAN